MRFRFPAAIILTSALALFSSQGIAATPPKAGASCSKKGTTQSYQNKKFTCIANGKKLIWDKGVVVVKTQPSASPTPQTTPNPSPSASPTPQTTPTPSPSGSPTATRSPDDLGGLPCTKLNDIVRNSFGEYWCQDGGGSLRWAKNNVDPNPTPTTTITSKYQGQPCLQVGSSLIDNKDLYKCGAQQNGKLLWKWQEGPFSKETDKYDGQSCPKSFELLKINDTTYRCLTVGTIDLRWGYLDTSRYDTRTGDLCTTVGEKIKTINGFIRCEVTYGTILTYHAHNSEPVSSKNATKYIGIASEGKSCDASGDTFDIAGGFLECRYVHGNILNWVRINTPYPSFANPASPEGVETCRLKNADVPYSASRWPDNEAGFPLTARNGMKNPGVNNVLMVGIDFPENPGESTLAETFASTKKTYTEWFDYFSNGKVKMNVTTIDHWIRSPRAAKTYIDQDTNRLSLSQSAINKNADYNAQPIIDLVTKEIDLRSFSTIYVYLPKGEMDFNPNLIFRNHYFAVKEGNTHLNFFMWNSDVEALQWPQWAFAIHETLHDFPLPLHAPGNGWIQDNVSYALYSWNRFLMGWLPDDQIYCVEKSKLKTVDITLSPIEREDNMAKMATIKLSPTKAIVIQSHGIDKWSSFNANDKHFAPGFYGVVAYLVNLEDAGALSYGDDSRATSNDNGNDPVYPKWSYYMPLDGTGTFTSEFFDFAWWLNLNKYIAGLGDTFIIEGVKIQFVKTGEYDTVRISLNQ